MTVLGFCLVLGIIGVIFKMCEKSYSSPPAFVLGVVSAIFGFVALFLLLCLPIEINSKIEAFKAVQTTVEVARENGMDIEDAALQLKITEMNQWLASTQYYNTVFIYKDYVPNSVDDLEFIR